MDCTTSLRDAIQALARIDAAGCLGDLERELAHLPPVDRFARDPFFEVDADRLARAASRILGEPLWKCRREAREALAPTRQQQALTLIAQFGERLHRESEVVAWT